MCIHYERVPTIELMITSLTSYIYLLFSSGENTFRSTLSKFQLCTHVRNCHSCHKKQWNLRPWLVTNSLCSVAILPLLAPPPSPGSHCSALCFRQFDVVRFHVPGGTTQYLPFCVWLISPYSVPRFACAAADGRVSSSLRAK